MAIKFTENQKTGSQRTLIKVLKEHPYYFKTVNEYDNNFFTCVVKWKVKDSPLDAAIKKVKRNKEPRYVEITLSFGTCGTNGESIFEPIVFDREEVDQIVCDAPETYVGEKTL